MGSRGGSSREGRGGGERCAWERERGGRPGDGDDILLLYVPY